MNKTKQIDKCIIGYIYWQVQTPASATDASAEPSERVNTPTAETSGVPWDLGCGHTAKTLQHFLHVTVAMGLDHAYSRHQAVSKALIASSGSGHILDVGLPPWLSTAIRNSEVLESHVTHAGTSQNADHVNFTGCIHKIYLKPEEKSD